MHPTRCIYYTLLLLVFSSSPVSSLPYPRTLRKQWVLELVRTQPTTEDQASLLAQAQAFADADPKSITFLGQVGDIPGTFLYESTHLHSSIQPSTSRISSRKLRIQQNDRKEELIEQRNESQDGSSLLTDAQEFERKAALFFEGTGVQIHVEEQIIKRRQRRKQVGIDVEDSSVHDPVLPRRKSRVAHLDGSTLPDTVLSSVPKNPMGWNDPFFHKQWNLYNDGSNGRIAGNDINVVPVWKQNITGSGVTITLLDDGIELEHPDFNTNTFSLSTSYDFSTKSPSPLPRTPEDIHGTRCAGQIASAPNNSLCGVGVAYGARLAGERVLTGATTDAVEAQALNWMNQENDIYSSSWGPDDDGESVDGPGRWSSAALERGVQVGRGGKGSVFVFASGNGGGEAQDNCNFDGYANSIYTIAVGAINHRGVMPSYGEFCAAHLGVTFSGGAGVGIWTTDVGGGCTGVHSGTSAAAPVTAGIIALMLEARPELGWRDLQDIIVRNGDVTDENDSSWSINGAGLKVSHKYGFGKLNADKLVQAAKSRSLLLPTPQLEFRKKAIVGLKFPTISVGSEQNEPTFKSVISVTPSNLKNSRISSLEHVQVKIHLLHPARRFLTIVLTSPAGTKSFLATPRPFDVSTDGFDPWTFMSVHYWGEKPFGDWTLEIFTSVQAPQNLLISDEDQFYDWTLILRGTCNEAHILSLGIKRVCQNEPY
ncbi:hypothetical protein BCR33DRAFT_682101 [Rhizoclosmatium globosum]|uniref:P/Homo B domain-containing protein n=1 Tax=Rhizoclosmatium globosum TaxID=329046 RepID=A0A1Y2BWS4_9FUNG|nr:hypothetical protein BCR33DRAFT_682101 [Rhizoclosmatium globosum]|eukprot:ORY39097.1 hypothetical protein BCR33DRAFT_682101 [Rhizoclosmatium globosum]